ncbi:MAG: nucleotidyltransferase family protein [Deltaproteobacteria bacterium]|nr:nucleotidyltransferase family protein [Deltaproteobacteria bacterium]
MARPKGGTLRKVAGLILAAGASTRIGAPKQLLPAGDTCILDLVLKEALDSNLHRVYLVLGYESDRIMARLRTDPHHSKLSIVENPAYKQGMSTSIIAGLSLAETLYGDIMIILADMPFVNREVINRLLHSYLHSGLPLGAVKVGGKRSHPVIVNRVFYGDLHRLKGDVGARGLFRKFPDRVFLLEVDEGPYDMDIDTMEDYEKFREYIKNHSRERG